LQMENHLTRTVILFIYQKNYRDKFPLEIPIEALGGIVKSPDYGGIHIYMVYGVLYKVIDMESHQFVPRIWIKRMI